MNQVLSGLCELLRIKDNLNPKCAGRIEYCESKGKDESIYDGR